MHYNMAGKIAIAHPYQLDPTLTVEGAGAEAKATGEAIKETNETLENHVKDKNNPHGVSKKQLGLEKVDNTSDSEKPVSTLQAKAIQDALLLADEAKDAARAANELAKKGLLRSGGTMEGAIDMGGNRIYGLPDPTEDGDIITKSYMENYINDTFLGGEW